jgi:shikimate dehydrogenase
MTDRYAVIGNPISHSKSPQIHKMFAEQTGQDISYEKIESPLDGFAATIERLRKEGYKGCNVTVPFKFEAFQLATRLSPHADIAHAANTLKLNFDGDTIFGDNTDGFGLVRDITQNLKFKIAGKRVLLLGAGGAADGVALPLSSQQPHQIVIANRTVEKAQAIEMKAKNTPQLFITPVVSSSYPNLARDLIEDLRRGTKTHTNNLKISKNQFDLVINATSTGLLNEMPPLPSDIFAPGALAYDMMYGRETPFMKFAREHGAEIVTDGLGMLVEQAAESFFIWRGVRPATAPVIAALRMQR